MTSTAENPDRLGRCAWERAGKGPDGTASPRSTGNETRFTLRYSGAAT